MDYFKYFIRSFIRYCARNLSKILFIVIFVLICFFFLSDNSFATSFEPSFNESYFTQEDILNARYTVGNQIWLNSYNTTYDILLYYDAELDDKVVLVLDYNNGSFSPTSYYTLYESSYQSINNYDCYQFSIHYNYSPNTSSNTVSVSRYSLSSGQLIDTINYSNNVFCDFPFYFVNTSNGFLVKPLRTCLSFYKDTIDTTPAFYSLNWVPYGTYSDADNTFRGNAYIGNHNTLSVRELTTDSLAIFCPLRIIGNFELDTLDFSLFPYTLELSLNDEDSVNNSFTNNIDLYATLHINPNFSNYCYMIIYVPTSKLNFGSYMYASNRLQLRYISGIFTNVNFSIYNFQYSLALSSDYSVNPSKEVRDYYNSSFEGSEIEDIKDNTDTIINEIGGITNSIDDLSNTISDSSIDNKLSDFGSLNSGLDIPDTTGIDTLFQMVYNAFTSDDIRPLVITIPFVDYTFVLDGDTFLFPQELLDVVSVFCWGIVGLWILKDVRFLIHSISIGSFHRTARDIKSEVL